MKNNTLKTLTEQEYNNKNYEVHSKVANGNPLTIEEKYFFCDNLKNEHILQYSMCHDEFYYRYFLDYYHYDYDTQKLYKWHDIHFDYFRGMVREWKNVISDERIKDKLLKTVAEETRKELKQHRKSNTILDIGFSSAKFDKEIFLISAWSRFRYILIKRTIELFYKNGEYTISFNGMKVILNYKSLTHITSRHFGKDLKPYNTDKDFFSKHFLYDNLHTLLEEIFNEIDDAALLTSGFLKELSFRFKGDLYKVYFEEFTKQQKGVPDVKVIILSTFFPLSDKRMLDNLAKNNTEQHISQNLSVFVLN